MRPIKTQIIQSDGKELLVVAVNLQNNAGVALPKKVKSVFSELSPYLKNSRQVAYLRDLPELSIGKYVGGTATDNQEVQIASPKWPAKPAEVVGTFAHELHHLVRMQRHGYGTSLGEALVTEGLACLYSEERAGWQAPWTKGSISQQTYDQARRDWSKKSYDHRQWFFTGPLGKWVGYRLGYRLVKECFKEGFDLKKSLELRAKDVKPLLK